MNTNEDLDPMLEKKFKAFQRVHPPSCEDMAAGRAAFLAEAQQVAQFVTQQEKRRHIRWIDKFQNLLTFKKEISTMPGMLTTLLLITALLFGGSGITVAAAQSSLPDEPLYSVKTLSEDVRLALASNPEAAYQLALDFATRRIDEIEILTADGTVPPEDVLTRYQAQSAETLRLITGMPADQGIRAMEQVITRLQTQQKALQQVDAQSNPQADAVLLRTRQMVRAQLQLVQDGLVDPTLLQELNLDNSQKSQETSPQAGSGNPWVEGTPTPGSGYGPGDGTGTCLTCTPQGTGTGVGGQGGNPWVEGTPTPGSGYGPGDGTGTCLTCTPQGTGTGVGGQGGNPWVEGTPIPDSSYGPGPGLDTTTNPQNSSDDPGGQPENQGPQADPGQNSPSGQGGKGGKN